MGGARSRIGRTNLRDRRGCTRRKYKIETIKPLKKAFGDLPTGWDVYPVFEHGLNRDTWGGSTQRWQVRQPDGTTEGRRYGNYKSPAEAWNKALEDSALVQGTSQRNPLPDYDWQTGLPSDVTEGDPMEYIRRQRAQLRNGGGYIRSNDACRQFNSQVVKLGKKKTEKGRRISTQKENSFRRWLDRWKAEGQKGIQGGSVRRISDGEVIPMAGNDTYWLVDSINEKLYELHGNDAPVIVATCTFPP